MNFPVSTHTGRSAAGPGPHDDVVASVILPAHNAEETICDQLEALAVQVDPPAFEVIVVANCCTDSTVELARSFTDRLNLAVVIDDDRASAAHARNAGVSHARGRILLFCDADDCVGETWVAGMVEPLESGRADFVGGSVIIRRSRSPRWMRSSDDRRPPTSRCLIGKVLPYAMSATLGVRREAFSAVGGFDPDFPAAGTEEQDLQFRLYRHGYRIGEAPDATLTYSLRTTYAGLLSQQRAYALGSKVLAAKEGRLRSPSLAGTIRKILRRWGTAAIRTRNVHPVFYVFIAHLNLAQWRDHRRYMRGRPTALPESRHSTIDFCAPLAAPAIGGLGFAATDSKSASYLATDAGIELDTISLLSHLLPIGGKVVDVGAHIGTFAAAAARLGGPAARIDAFEPAPHARDVLAINVDRHRIRAQIAIHPVAAGDRSGSRRFCVFSNGLVSGFEIDRPVPDSGDLLELVDVDVVRLDDVIQAPVDILKIDVEGFEVGVLRGASRLMESSLNIAVIFEMNPGALRRAGSSPDELLSFFPDSAWDLYLVDEVARYSGAGHADRTAVPLDTGMIDLRSARTGWYANIVAVRAGRKLNTSRP